MHIELTDHLRCPESHEEGYLILLPELMEGRRVMAGVLACPTCGWQTSWTNSIPDFGGAWKADDETRVPAEAVPPMLGIEGGGGWIALGASAGRLADTLAALMPGVGIIAVNPPADVAPTETISIIRGKHWPIKSHALRGLVISEDGEPWRDDAFGSLLPGRQMIGSGRYPSAKGAEVIAEAGGVWIVKR